jgi:hypothetical protein
MSCCGQLSACLNNTDCALIYECLDGVNIATPQQQMDCADESMANFGAGGPLAQQVYQCRMGACPTDCPA